MSWRRNVQDRVWRAVIGPIRKHSALNGSEEKYCVLIGPGDEFNDG